jgi:hypothetical protein
MLSLASSMGRQSTRFVIKSSTLQAKAATPLLITPPMVASYSTLLKVHKPITTLFMNSALPSFTAASSLRSTLCQIRFFSVKPTLLEQQLISLNEDITATAADIKEKETELKAEMRGGKDKDIIEFLKESLIRLDAEKATLHAERKELQHDLATQSSQGKSSTRVCALNELV